MQNACVAEDLCEPSSYNIPENFLVIISTVSQITAFYTKPQASTRAYIQVFQGYIRATTYIYMTYSNMHISLNLSSFQKTNPDLRHDVRTRLAVTSKIMCYHTEEMWFHLA